MKNDVWQSRDCERGMTRTINAREKIRVGSWPPRLTRVRDKTILSPRARARASSESAGSLILHREHCSQHESSVARTCPFRSVVPVRAIPVTRYSSLSTAYSHGLRKALGDAYLFLLSDEFRTRIVCALSRPEIRRRRIVSRFLFIYDYTSEYTSNFLRHVRRW